MHSPNNFEIIDQRQMDELKAHVTFYRHLKTGAEILSVENDDTNKVFGIALRTPAHDSTGVAHILEHTVLCGSKKYPVKDPFQELMKGSVYTFLNAMTYSDKTVYPVASENLQDFYNLMDIQRDEGRLFLTRRERLPRTLPRAHPRRQRRPGLRRTPLRHPLAHPPGTGRLPRRLLSSVQQPHLFLR